MTFRRLAMVGAMLASFIVPSAGKAAEPYTINAILPLTGSGAFLGQAEATGLAVIERQVDDAGGIRGRPIAFAIKDDQSNPSVDLQLASGLIAQNVPVIIGPALVAGCSAIAPLLKNGPVLYCLSPGFHPYKDSFGFHAITDTLDSMRVTIRFFRSKGWHKVASITSNDASGQDGERNIAAVMSEPQNAAMTVVATEHFTPGDLSVAAQMARIKSAGAQAIIAWATGSSFATILHGARDTGLDVPIATTQGNASVPQMTSYATFMPALLLIAGELNLAPAQVPKGQVRDAIDRFYSAFQSQGHHAELLNSVSWDPAAIVISALKDVGLDANAAQIRAYIENLHGWAGADGMYDFRGGSRNGLDDKSQLMCRWDPVKNAFVGLSKAGGEPL